MMDGNGNDVNACLFNSRFWKFEFVMEENHSRNMCGCTSACIEDHEGGDEPIAGTKLIDKWLVFVFLCGNGFWEKVIVTVCELNELNVKASVRAGGWIPMVRKTLDT
jgi:hypothetical protein